MLATTSCVVGLNLVIVSGHVHSVVNGSKCSKCGRWVWNQVTCHEVYHKPCPLFVHEGVENST